MEAIHKLFIPHGATMLKMVYNNCLKKRISLTRKFNMLISGFKSLNN